MARTVGQVPWKDKTTNVSANVCAKEFYESHVKERPTTTLHTTNKMAAWNGITTHGGRTWYSKYKPSSKRPELAFLSGKNPNYVLARDVTCNNGKVVKAYSGFNSSVDLACYVEKNPNDSLYELMQANQGERKIYFDIDDNEVPLNNVTERRNFHLQHLGEITSALIRMFQEHNLHLSEEDIRIYESCGPKNNTEYKFSFHYVVTGYRTWSHQQVKSIADAVIERVGIVTTTNANGEEVANTTCIDRKPYMTVQAFRMLSSCKSGSNRRKKLLNRTEQPGWYTIVGPGGIMYDFQEKGYSLPQGLRSLITHPAPLQVPASFYPPPEVKKEYDGKTLDGNNLEEALQHIVRAVPILEGQFASGENGRVNRITPGWCPTCQRQHDNENAFLYIAKSGHVVYYCFRAEGGTRLGGVFIEPEAVKDDNKEEEPIVSLPSKLKYEQDSEVRRAYECEYSRIAYREKIVGETLTLTSKSEKMEDPLSSFAAKIPIINANSYMGSDHKTRMTQEEGGMERQESDAMAQITIIEELVIVTGMIATQYKLLSGNIVLFRDTTKVKRNVNLAFKWKRPSTGKIVKGTISVEELLAGSYIDGYTFRGGSFPDIFTESIKKKLYGEIETRRNAARRRHETFHTKLGDMCTTPFFRNYPAPLPNKTSVNVFPGFDVDPFKYLYNADKSRNSTTFTDFKKHYLLEVIYILIEYGVAQGVVNDADKIMKFLAHSLANLDDPKTQKCLAVIGDYGTGKSTLGSIMTDIFGILGINTSLERTMGRFNGILAGKIFAMLDEPEPAYNADGTTSAAQKAAASAYTARFKEFITGDNMTLENKYCSEFKAKMSINFYLSSNNFDISVLEVNDYRKDRRPLVYDSRTCCMHIMPDNTRFYYFYATGESSSCVDMNGVILNPHPTPQQVMEDKIRFYNALHFYRSNPEFLSLFAASLLAYAYEYGTHDIISYVQPNDHPVVVKMRNGIVSNSTRFLNYLCGDEYKSNEAIPSLSTSTREALKNSLVPNEDGVIPSCYFVEKGEIYKVFKAWFINKIGNYVPTEETFWKDVKAYALRNNDKISMADKVGKVDTRVWKEDVVDGKKKKKTGFCFITYSSMPPSFGAPTPTSDEKEELVSNTPLVKEEQPKMDELTKPSTTPLAPHYPSPFANIDAACNIIPKNGITPVMITEAVSYTQLLDENQAMKERLARLEAALLRAGV